MRLKTLSLSGFKSFADRTRLDFEPGVNVVVGPNGSGKSNLVDAVSWVMGTQATTQLRTERMEEVIFSGTATRPARDRAEVSLTFDNTERMLPLDVPELTVTRRLHRDGTSEYEINGTPCRLLDIQELLNDGNVGRHQHVIIAQGRIESILNSRPEEHRAAVEEAAGVVKHRNRRDRSIRRLEATDEDTKRLRDILREYHKHMKPLRRQAEAAERHEATKAEVHALRLYLGGRELRAILDRIAEAEAAESRHREELARGRHELAEIEASLGRLEGAAGEAGRALERDTAAAARLETTAERLRRVGTVARERRVALDSRRRGAGERRRDLELEAQDLRRQLADGAEEERRQRARAERAEVALHALEDEERSLAEQDRLPVEGVVAALRGDLGAMEAGAERDRREEEAIARRSEILAVRIEDERREAERLTTEIERADAEVGAAQGAYDDTKLARELAQREWELAEEGRQAAGFEATAAQARVEALRAVLGGVADPAARDRAQTIDGILASLEARLDVPPALASAVTAALGPWVEGLVLRDADALAAAVAELKADGMGGVPLVSAVDTGHAPARKIAAEWGVDALVDRLGPGADSGLAEAMLGDVILVEGWSSGWTLVQRNSSVRAVTPEGDLITAFGVRPADPAGITPAALEEAEAALEEAETAVARADSVLIDRRRTFEAARTNERNALESLEVLEARLAGSTEALALIQRTRAESEAEASRLGERRQALAETAVSRQERVAELRQRLDAFEGEEAARHEAWEAMNRRLQEVTRRRDEARRTREEATAALGAIRERHRLTEKRLAEVSRQLAQWEEAPAEEEQAIDRLQLVEDRAWRALAIVKEHVATLRERQRALREQAGSAGDRLDSTHRRQRDLEDTVAEARDAASALAVELAELRTRREAVAEALRREADASEEEALGAEPPALEEDADPAERLESLENELRRMGPVNPLAAAEYRQLAEEAEFLESQLADLEESRRELRKVIKALDDKIADLFTGAFAEIAVLFEENFSGLFPGGKGRLVLTDPDDPLETGIEIEAQPLGKKVSRLSLLSGGERSLAALAFLFAVFRARPSPFYLLDEVEAALDDANLRRFLRLVELLGRSAQLIVVTHQQQTMEAGDILYGVTLEPGESSKVLAKRLSHAVV